MTESPTGVLVELDNRRQLSLGRVGRHERYLAREERDGTIVLTPAVVMKASELDALIGSKKNPKKSTTAKKATRSAPKKTAAVTESVPAPAGTDSVSATGLVILDVVRKAGPGGISASDLVKAVPGSRSRAYGELGVLRRTGRVVNPTGKYTIGT